MKGFLPFFKKEWMEMSRSGKLFVLLLLFVLFGILSPALAKGTPYLYKAMEGALKEQGFTITDITVNALTCWQQYYKNLSMELIVFFLFFAGILTNEYQKNTLILMVTKGVKKPLILGVKFSFSLFMFSVCYWLCYGITYLYSILFWDNTIVSHLFLAAGLAYIFGILLLALLFLFSTIVTNVLNVLLLMGLSIVVFYGMTFFPEIKKASPMLLLSGMDLLENKIVPLDVVGGIISAIIFSLISVGLAILFFQKREL